MPFDMHEKPLPTIIFGGYDLSSRFIEEDDIEEEPDPDYLPEPSYGMDPDYDPPSADIEYDPEIPF